MKLHAIALGIMGLVLVGGGTLGCGGAGGSGSSKTSGASHGTVVDPEKLPSLGGYIPPLDSEAPGLDENRVKVPFPKGWSRPPRVGQVVVWFKESPQHDYPQILVTAEDFESVMNVNASTVSEFVRALSAHLRKKNPSISIQVASIQVGDRYGALYRRLGRVKSEFTTTEVERLIIETVVEGRKYAFELRTYPGHVEKYAPYLYAVFSGTKFLKGSGAPTPPKPEEKPTPTETPPEQPKPESPPEKEKPEPPAEKPPAKPEPTSEKPKPEEKPTTEPKQPPATKPAEPKPEPKSEPAEKPKKKKKPFDFDIQ